MTGLVTLFSCFVNRSLIKQTITENMTRYNYEVFIDQ